MFCHVKSVARELPLFFRSLSDPTRLRILNLLCEGEVCVCHLVAVLRMVQPKVSRHLAYLRKMGVVIARRDGKWMHYAWKAPSHPAARVALEGLREWMIADRGMASERRKIRQARCA